MAEHPPVMDAGVLHHPGVSTQGHSVAFCSRAGRTNAIHDLVADGLPAAWREGPLLENVEYPDVLVAKAVSDWNGTRSGAPARREIPDATRWVCRSCDPERATDAKEPSRPEVGADAEGRASVTVELDGRREVRVRSGG